MHGTSRISADSPRRSRPRLLRSLIVLTMGGVGFLFSCKESLPPFEEPADFLKGVTIASYTYGADNMLTVSIAIENTFDETLQNVAQFSGTVRITPHGDPSFSRTLTLGPNSITQVGNYNPITRVLTFDPGEVIWLQAKWNFMDDRGRNLRDSLFVYVDDPTCAARKIAHRQRVTIEASVVVFEQVGHVRCAPVELSFCHIDRFVSVRDCPSINPDSACNLIEQ